MRAAAERRVNAVVPSTRRRVESVTNTDRRLRIIVGNALQFGRRDSARVERVDLAAWSKEFITEFWQAEEIDGATVRLSAPRDTVYVRVDPAHLHRLLWTLCGDLLKYGRIDRAPDPVELRVGRSATTQRRYLDVIDRGKIASVPDGRRVFEPFLAVGKVGTGIALFVSRELAPGSRTSSGSELRPDGGVVFRFVFADAQRKAS
jgi:two-component system sensor histidine kinase PilS (NtrC family)